MPSSTSDFTVNVNDVLYVDRWGISTLTTFNTNLGIQVWNQSPRPVYVKAIINDASGNWKFDDDTTAKQLGSVGGFDYATLNVTLKRAVPASDIEDEQFTITFEFYKDSSYSQKVDQITKTITANIIDFHASPSGWTVNIDDFDDGTAQGWSADLFGVSDIASVQANGYSMYYYYGGSTTHKYPNISKLISVPTGISKAGLMFYWGGVTYGYCPYHCYNPRIYYVRVYINDSLVYEEHVDAGGGHTHNWGWYQVGLDLSAYAGQNISIKIELEVRADNSSWVKVAVDDVIFAYK